VNERAEEKRKEENPSIFKSNKEILQPL